MTIKDRIRPLLNKPMFIVPIAALVMALFLVLGAFLFVKSIYWSLVPEVVMELRNPVNGERLVLVEEWAWIHDPGWTIVSVADSVEVDFSIPPIRWAEGFRSERNKGYYKRKSGVRKLLSTYEEGTFGIKDPRMRIEHGRFLVFSRGGLDHSLFDLESDSLVIRGGGYHGYNEHVTATVDRVDRRDALKDDDLRAAWTKRTLHDPIGEYLRPWARDR